MEQYNEYEPRISDYEWTNMTYQFNTSIELQNKLYKELRAVVMENKELKQQNDVLKSDLRSEFRNIYDFLKDLKNVVEKDQIKTRKLAVFQNHMMERFGTDLLENEIYHECKIDDANDFFYFSASAGPLKYY